MDKMKLIIIKKLNQAKIKLKKMKPGKQIMIVIKKKKIK